MQDFPKWELCKNSDGVMSANVKSKFYILALETLDAGYMNFSWEEEIYKIKLWNPKLDFIYFSQQNNHGGFFPFE